MIQYVSLEENKEAQRKQFQSGRGNITQIFHVRKFRKGGGAWKLSTEKELNLLVNKDYVQRTQHINRD